ncbi:hypothetical protein EV121DRAFT_288561 [Schizophyllum commune]
MRTSPSTPFFDFDGLLLVLPSCPLACARNWRAHELCGLSLVAGLPTHAQSNASDTSGSGSDGARRLASPTTHMQDSQRIAQESGETTEGGDINTLTDTEDGGVDVRPRRTVSQPFPSSSGAVYALAVAISLSLNLDIAADDAAHAMTCNLARLGAMNGIGAPDAFHTTGWPAR